MQILRLTSRTVMIMLTVGGLLLSIGNAAGAATRTEVLTTTASPATPRPAVRTVVVTDANNEGAVTLSPGDILVVRLVSNASTGFSWCPVMNPGFPVQMVGHSYAQGTQNHRGQVPIVGAPGVEEFRFAAPSGYRLGFSMAAWQRMLYLAPFEPGIKGARLWEIRVNLKPRSAR